MFARPPQEGENACQAALTAQATITIESRGTADYPAGVRFGSHFVPLPDTYVEVKQ